MDRPTRAQLQAAAGTTLPDVIAPGLRVLFCGINPSLYSAAVGHHFARPGNRFWPALHLGGFTTRRLSPAEDRTLLEHGLGLTNVVARATAGAAELGPQEYAEGAALLREKIAVYRPRWIAVLGLQAYRLAFARPAAATGRQPVTVASTGLWVLPNPSGLNAHYQLPALAALFAELRCAGEGARR